MSGRRRPKNWTDDTDEGQVNDGEAARLLSLSKLDLASGKVPVCSSLYAFRINFGSPSHAILIMKVKLRGG